MFARPAPFSRVIRALRAVAAVMALPIEQQLEALHGLEPYKSRGKGRGSISPRFGNKSGKYKPHQGKRECARRQRQFFGETQP